jgi:cob(I)alamin adenosyltransferase
MKIYTKVGDGGSTRLFGGAKVGKDDPRVEVLGGVDELSAAVGLARAYLGDDPLAETLAEIQRLLHVLGADIATPRSAKTSKKVPRIVPLHASWAEKEIDRLDALLPPLKTFILPGGSTAGAALHLARSVCRRAERAVIPLLKKKWASKDAQIFLNRLSDLLFNLARQANRRAGKPEIPC